MRPWIAAALVAFAVSAPAPSAERAPEVVLGCQQEPDGLDDLFSQMSSGAEVRGCISEGLAERDDRWVLRPALATEIPSFQNGGWTVERRDGKVVRMKTVWRLKENLRWSDGQPLSSKDFEFAWRVKMDPKVTGITTRTVEEKIGGIECPDDRTLIVHWKAPYAYADEGPHLALPRHVVEPLYKAAPEKLETRPEIRTVPLSNGPYMIASPDWKKKAVIELVLNPHWNGEKPRLQRIVYRFITDSNTLVSAFDAAQTDAITTVGVTMPQGLDIDRRKDPDVRVFFTPGMAWEHIDCNLDSPILADKRVRQALLYGMDREKIVKALYEGKQAEAHSWLPPKPYGFHPEIKRYGFDPGRAKALLEEAGWKAGVSGVREKDGKPLRLTLMTTSGNEVRQQVSEILQAQWRAIGVGLEIQTQVSTTFFGDTNRKRKFPHLAMYAWTFGPSSDGENLWTKDRIPSEKNRWTGDNTCGWIHDEASEIDARIPMTLEKEERVRLFRREQEIWADELPALPLYFRADVTVRRRGLLEWRPTGSLDPVTWNCESWRWGEEKE